MLQYITSSISHKHKQKIKLIFLFALLFYIQAQTPCLAQEYEYWGDDYFTDTLRLDTNTIESKVFTHLSLGMFPEVVLFPHFSIVLNSFTWNFSSGSFLFNDNYPFQFSAQPPGDDVIDKMEEREKFSDENKYNWLVAEPEQQNADIGISFTYPFPRQYHTFVDVSVGYTDRNLFAFSPIRYAPYLNSNNEKSYFQTMSFAEIRDKTVYGDVLFKHPLYGLSTANVSAQQRVAENIFYYLMYGIGCDVSLSDKINVFEYVMSNQDEVRFAGGDIREASTFKEDFDRIDKARMYYLLGFGWQMTSSDYYFDVELRYKAALEPTIKDSDYKQKQWYFRGKFSWNMVYDTLRTMLRVLTFGLI